MLLLLLHVLLNVLELLLVASKLMLMTGLRKGTDRIVEAIIVGHLHLSTIDLNRTTIDTILTRICGNHLMLHWS